MSISRFEKFNYVLDEYMPQRGEGETIASQIATAVAKIAYRWFNDGDTVSSAWDVEGASHPGGVAQFANWLYKNVDRSRGIFNIWRKKFEKEFITDSMYEDFLYNILSFLLDPDLLDRYVTEPKRDSIYNSKKYENGVFLGEEEYEDSDAGEYEDGMWEDDW